MKLGAHPYRPTLTTGWVRTPSHSHPLLPLPPLRQRHFLHYPELYAPLHVIDTVHKHMDRVAHRVGLASALPDNLARVLVVQVAIVGERCQRYQPLDEQVVQLDEHPKLG